FDDDIDFQTRVGTWDIGFDEYVAPIGGADLKASILGTLRGSSGSMSGSCMPDEIKIKRKKRRGDN
ncbi:hypothetical protein, partial [Candidatus Magnetobacterium casense]|uniref:hypothetical protein n=1 Tax=Candidatus Magnetobacterium casense TaxID=1455061 RepID=UPI001C49593A